MKIFAEAQRAPWNGSFEIFVALQDREGKRFNLKPIPTSTLDDPGGLLEEATSDFVMRGPTFALAREDAQNLLDSLHNAGLRPSHSQDAAGVVAAKDEHIQDLRRIAFHREEERVEIVNKIQPVKIDPEP